MRLYCVEIETDECQWLMWMVLALDKEGAVAASGALDRPDVLITTLNVFESASQAWVVSKPDSLNNQRTTP